MMSVTDPYQASEIVNYYSDSRVRWDQLYSSEKAVFEALAPDASTKVLDLGCGCGGLGLALSERFEINSYTGIELNREAAKKARRMQPTADIISADIMYLSDVELRGLPYDLVISLSCIDWHQRFEELLLRAMSWVKPSGYLVASFRLTPEESIIDIDESFQYINFSDARKGGKACYVVLNPAFLFSKLRKLHPSHVIGRGYWGKPSETATTPYGEICFCVFALQRGDPDCTPKLDLSMPADIERLSRVGLAAEQL